MVSRRTVLLELPAELFERVRELANGSNRAVEAVLLDSLAVLFGTPPGDQEDEALAMLDGYTDDQLWAVVYQALTWPDNDRLRDLMARGRQARLTPAEEVELDALLDQVERYTLWRTRALWLLKERHAAIKSAV
jgi:hypothetical protein